MAEKSFPFRSIDGDRKYGADDWQEVFAAFFTNGVIAYGNQLEVAPSSGMMVEVDTGFAVISGAQYANTTPLSFTLDPADGVLNRIDRIVLRYSVNDREIVAAVLKGTSGATPSAPALTRSSTIYELSLAQIAVDAGVTSIASGDITSEMIDETVCGICTAQVDLSVILDYLRGEVENAEGGSLFELKRLPFVNTLLLPSAFTAIDRSDGENLFDGMLEPGWFDLGTGAESGSTQYLRTSNAIPVTAGNAYAFSLSSALFGGATVLWYNGASYLSFSDVGNGGSLTAPASATNMRIGFWKATSETVTAADIYWLMVNKGSTAEDFESYIDYAYQAKITRTGVLKTMFPQIAFGIDTTIATDAYRTYDGGVKFYAAAVPATAVVIPSIICWKAVS